MSTLTLSKTGTTILTTKIEITNVEAQRLDVSFDTISGNQPNTFGNQVVLWQNQNEIPFGTPPDASMQIPSNTQAGSLTFHGEFIITNASYIVGFAVGPTLNSPAQTYGNICSTSFIPASGSPSSDTNFEGKISDVRPGINSLSFDLENFPNGLDFKANGAWAAIWQSGAPSYYARPLATTQVTDTNGGSFNNVPLGRGLTYTVAVFMSGYNPTGNSNQETMATAYTFKN